MASARTFPREIQRRRHDDLLERVAQHLRACGFDVLRTGYEAGGAPYDPDLFVRGGNDLGFYLEIKHPDGPNIAIDLDEWLWFRTLQNVYVLTVWQDGRVAMLDIDSDRPQAWYAAPADRIPVLVAAELSRIRVQLRKFSPNDPRRSSNKPFIVYRPLHVLESFKQALDYIISKAGIGSG